MPTRSLTLAGRTFLDKLILGFCPGSGRRCPCRILCPSLASWQTDHGARAGIVAAAELAGETWIVGDDSGGAPSPGRADPPRPGRADFTEAVIAGKIWFSDASFGRDVDFNDAPALTFGGDTDFRDATFTEGTDRLPFKLTHVLSPGAQHVWPAGWGVGPEAKAGHLVVRVKHDGRSSS